MRAALSQKAQRESKRSFYRITRVLNGILSSWAFGMETRKFHRIVALAARLVRFAWCDLQPVSFVAVGGNVEAHAVHLPDQFLIGYDLTHLLLISQHTDDVGAEIGFQRAHACSSPCFSTVSRPLSVSNATVFSSGSTKRVMT